jgi:hypothetical protein
VIFDSVLEKAHDGELFRERTVPRSLPEIEPLSFYLLFIILVTGLTIKMYTAKLKTQVSF